MGKSAQEILPIEDVPGSIEHTRTLKDRIEAYTELSSAISIYRYMYEKTKEIKIVRRRPLKRQMSFPGFDDGSGPFGANPEPNCPDSDRLIDSLTKCGASSTIAPSPFAVGSRVVWMDREGREWRGVFHRLAIRFALVEFDPHPDRVFRTALVSPAKVRSEMEATDAR